MAIYAEWLKHFTWDCMNDNGVRCKEELRFLEIWDRIHKRILSDQCEARKLGCMLNNLKLYSDSAKKSCRHADREIYDALYCVLYEEINRKASEFGEASGADDSGLGMFYSQSSMDTLKAGIPAVTALLEATPQRPKTSKRRRPHKILLPSTNGELMEDSTFNVAEVSSIGECRGPYPYMATAVICCLACIIALAPHRFFPWFVTWITFNSPPPL